jgi:DNA-binding NtrC family response regulator
VRELSHVIERAVLWSQGDALDLQHLALSRTGNGEDSSTTERPALAPSAPSSAATGQPGFLLPPAGTELEQWEKALIEQALRECGGNQTKAAARLGITRDTLRYRLKKHGLG